MRYLWLLLGHLAVAIGFVGAFLPVLPTVPFLILAAWAYSKGSDRFEQWLLNHPVAGGPIRAWREHGVIPARAKMISCFMMAISLVVAWSFPTIPWWGKVGSGITILGAAAFVVSRPSVPRELSDSAHHPATVPGNSTAP
jgi:uncharacterized membrane protein YbaN (DUF454 family)